MGYSIRTGKYRYTIWLKDGYRSYKPFSKDLVVASELYDYGRDPNETVNVVEDKEYASVAKEMDKKMVSFLTSQQKNNKP
jgi:hypothetical protein